MGFYVMAAYRARPGRDEELLSLIREHVPVLRREGLATDREPMVMRATDGAIIEIFEWSSADAADRAYDAPAVQELWARFEDVCEYVKLGEVAGVRDFFAHFEAVEL